MTTHPLLRALLPLVDDLSRELEEDERYRRLLAALRALIPCDATALLRLEGEQLIPLAVDGLSPDTLGRRFALAEHPRFEVLLGEQSRGYENGDLLAVLHGFERGAHRDLGVLGVHGGDDRGERGAGVGGVGVGLAERGELHGPIPSQGGGSGPGAGGRETVRP